MELGSLSNAKPKKVILYSLLLPVFILLIKFIFNSEEKLQYFFERLVVLLIFWVAGLILAIFISAINPEAKRIPKHFFWSQIVIFSFVLGYVLYSDVPIIWANFWHSNKLHNHRIVGLNSDREKEFYGHETKSAFLALESEQKDPNSFKIKSFFIVRTDTSVSGVNNYWYDIFFLYQKNEEELFSMIRSENETKQSIVFIDQKTSENKIFIETYKTIKEEEIEMLNEVKKSLEEYSDSLNRTFKDFH